MWLSTTGDDMSKIIYNLASVAKKTEEKSLLFQKTLFIFNKLCIFILNINSIYNIPVYTILYMYV